MKPSKRNAANAKAKAERKPLRISKYAARHRPLLPEKKS